MLHAVQLWYSDVIKSDDQSSLMFTSAKHHSQGQNVTLPIFATTFHVLGGGDLAKN